MVNPGFRHKVLQNLGADSVWCKSGFLTDMLKSMYITAGFALAWLLSRAFPNRGNTFFGLITC